MISRLASIALAVGIMCASVSFASAIGIGSGLGALKRLPPSKYLAGRGSTLAPMGHVIFCVRNPSQCKVRGPASVKLSSKRLADLRTINTRVNRRIRAVNDSGANGFADTWTVSPTSGDCEDFALTKRHELIRRGWPSRAMRMAVVKTPEGVGHAVLVVRTSGGDLVLDNLKAKILPWNETDLTWLKIQSQANPRRWQAI